MPVLAHQWRARTGIQCGRRGIERVANAGRQLQFGRAKSRLLRSALSRATDMRRRSTLQYTIKLYSCSQPAALKADNKRKSTSENAAEIFIAPTTAKTTTTTSSSVDLTSSKVTPAATDSPLSYSISIPFRKLYILLYFIISC